MPWVHVVCARHCLGQLTLCFIVMHYLFHCDVLILFVSLCLCSSQYTHFPEKENVSFNTYIYPKQS